ncbi:hypothetical protein Taro_028010, partial [Colocasia esculenta]|nr:hypothetical protein [Colocasia esculenta]
MDIGVKKGTRDVSVKILCFGAPLAHVLSGSTVVQSDQRVCCSPPTTSPLFCNLQKLRSSSAAEALRNRGFHTSKQQLRNACSGAVYIERDGIGRNWTLRIPSLKRTTARKQCSCTHLTGSHVSDAVVQSFRNLTTSNAKQSGSRFQRQPLRFELSFDDATYNDLLLLATRKKLLVHGKLVHGHMIKACFRPCLFVENNLLSMYCKRRDMDTAHA